MAEVIQKDVPIYSEWIGTLDGFVNADIKAQVSGYLVKQEYTEGTFVKSGQLLFQIDPRPFQAALEQARRTTGAVPRPVGAGARPVAQAEAQVAVAEANQGRSSSTSIVTRRSRSSRRSPSRISTMPRRTISLPRHSFRRPKPKWKPPRLRSRPLTAAVQSAKAAVETARINLGFTRLTSPIDGIPGVAQQQVGALVSPASGAITTVSTVDPIKVYFTASEQEYLDYRRRFPTAEKRPGQQPAARTRVDSRRRRTVSAQGQVLFRGPRRWTSGPAPSGWPGLFPNPGNVLRPGQYGRVRTATRTQQGALLVPQQAVIDLQGTHQLAVVDSANKVSIRPVKLGETVGRDWIVREGVKPGERVDCRRAAEGSAGDAGRIRNRVQAR